MDQSTTNPPIDWNTPAGEVLLKLAAALPQDRSFRITVFGSAPLQLLIDPSVLSADVDVFSDTVDLEQYVRAAGLAKGIAPVYIDVCSSLAFRSSPNWASRSIEATSWNCTFGLVAPMDVLISKLFRLEEKDLAAFRTVIRKTGHPTETELLHELQMAVDLFRPGFDEERTSDLSANTQRLWMRLFEHEINVRAEIIEPALKQRASHYGIDAKYKKLLRQVSQ